MVKIVSTIPNGRSGGLPGGKPASVCAPDRLFQGNAERGEWVVAATASGCRGACRRVLACPEEATRVRPRRDVLVTSSRWTPCALAQPLPDPASRPPNRSLSVPARAAWPLPKPRLSRHTRPQDREIQRAHIDRFPSGKPPALPFHLPRGRDDRRAPLTREATWTPPGSLVAAVLTSSRNGRSGAHTLAGSPTGHLLDLPFAAPDSVTVRTRSAP